MRRHTQRLYRAARAITGDDHEARDIVQETYVRAYQYLDQFAGRARFSTWLTRIAVNEALTRKHRARRLADIEEASPTLRCPRSDPEREVSDRELAEALEEAIGRLPDIHRSVFILRELDGLSTAETAARLEITKQATKSRMHRARMQLRDRLFAHVGARGRLDSVDSTQETDPLRPTVAAGGRPHRGDPETPSDEQILERAWA
jgi:RNA polymerase sigma-70 factor (ECF subfamily)